MRKHSRIKHIGTGHYVCIVCGEYIRPERKQKIVRLENNQKAHKKCVKKENLMTKLLLLRINRKLKKT